MALTRRTMLTGLAASALARQALAGEPAGAAWLTTRFHPATSAAEAVALSADGMDRWTAALPGRGHDIALDREARRAVVVARRPGRWAAVFDTATGRPLMRFAPPEGRHFFGHGVFDATGRLFMATENDISSCGGLIGVYDASAGFAPLGAFASAGRGPHDVLRLPSGLLAIANGGTCTRPDTGRTVLNEGALESNLAIINPACGTCIGVADLLRDTGPDLARASLRHMAIAPDGTLAFGLRWEGEEADAPPLVGLFDGDRLRLLDAPDDAWASARGYIGDIAFDRTGDILAATSPVGGVVLFFDRASGRYLGRVRRPDLCGLAPWPDRPGFVASSGVQGLFALLPDQDPRSLATPGQTAFDNHMTPLAAGPTATPTKGG